MPVFSGAAVPLKNSSCRSSKGSCGSSEIVAVSRPVLGSASSRPGSLKTTPDCGIVDADVEGQEGVERVPAGGRQVDDALQRMVDDPGVSIATVPILEASGQLAAASVKCGVPGAKPPSGATLSGRGVGGGTGIAVTRLPAPVSVLWR